MFRWTSKYHQLSKKDTLEEEKQDLPTPGSQSSMDGVAMGTGGSTHMEVTGCWKLCWVERNHLEGPFCLWLWWTAKTHKCKCRVSRRKVNGGAPWWGIWMICCSWTLFAVWAEHFLHLCMALSQPVRMLLCPRCICVYFAPTWLQLSYIFIFKTPTAVKMKPKYRPKPEGMPGKGLKNKQKVFEGFSDEAALTWWNVGSWYPWWPSDSLGGVSCFQNSDLSLLLQRK